MKNRAAPLVAVDQVTIVDEHTVTGTKVIKADDPYLEGHYPHFTIYPGIFIIESVHQVIDHFVRSTRGKSVLAELAEVRTVRFTAPLTPGDTLSLSCALKTEEDGELVVKAVGLNQRGEKAAQMTLGYRLVEEDSDV
ncbi:3-hydroxyacyl-ACP dehydratase FabZ family protein [Kitasatospora sp. P5_F3]